MNILPLEIALSYKQTNRFSSIKSRTGITPNIMARIAILKALEDNIEPEKLEKASNLSQKIPRDIAFGDFIIYLILPSATIQKNIVTQEMCES